MASALWLLRWRWATSALLAALLALAADSHTSVTAASLPSGVRSSTLRFERLVLQRALPPTAPPRVTDDTRAEAEDAHITHTSYPLFETRKYHMAVYTVELEAPVVGKEAGDEESQWANRAVAM